MLIQPDIERDTYLFLCVNKRLHAKACGTDQSEHDYEYFRKAINEQRPKFKSGRIVKVNKSGCLAKCIQGPNIVIFPDNVWYTYTNTDDIDEIINEHLIAGRIVERLQRV